MAFVKAKALTKGDVIGIIAPASPPRSMERVERSVKYFERLGYRVEVGKHVRENVELPALGYLAAPDKDRVADLHAMFHNKHIRAIFYHRGGYGSIRLLDAIDYALIRRNPKIVVGYSDATSLFMAFHKKAALSSCFFGPMAGVDLWNNIDAFSEDHLWRAITSTGPLGALPIADGEGTRRSRSSTVATGRMIGGNLTVFSSLMGTPYQPSFRGVIPFFEEIDEKPRKVDAHFAQLALAGLWKQSKAVLLGQFTGCNKDPDAATLSLDEIFAQYFGKLKVPVVSSLPFGHEPRMWTIPYGARVRVSRKRGKAQIEVLDAGLE